MSDQPAGNPSFDATIPGFTNALARLSSVAASAGYRVVAVTVAPHPSAQTSRTRPPPVTVTITSHSAPFSPRSSPSTPIPSLPTSSPIQSSALPVPSPTITGDPHQALLTPTSSPPVTSAHPVERPLRTTRTALKRRSEASISSLSASHPNLPKRTRLSLSPTRHSPPTQPFRTQPPSLIDRQESDNALDSTKPSTAYWGTVLADRPQQQQKQQRQQQQQQQQIRQHELGQRSPLIGPSIWSPSPHFPTTSHPISVVERTGTQQTMPSMSTTSVPTSFLRPVEITRASRATEEHPPPPLLQQPLQPRPSVSSAILRRTGHILSRIAPFTAQEANQPHLPPGQAPFHSVHSSSALPNITLPPFQQSLGAQPYVSSSSRSASASGISHAQPSPPPLSSSPEGMVAPLPGVIEPNPPKRGRRSSAQSLAPGIPLYKCTFCEAEFRRKSDKTRHIRVVHEKSRPFTCDLCGKTFGEKSNMLKHRASVHHDIRTFRCAYCNAVFSQRAVCDHHVRSVHDKKQAKYFCEQCGLPFTKKNLLHEHYADAHPHLLKAYQAYEAAAAGAEAVEAAAMAAAEAAERGERRHGGEMGAGVYARDSRLGVRSLDPFVTAGASATQYGVGSSMQHAQAARFAEERRREDLMSRKETRKDSELEGENMGGISRMVGGDTKEKEGEDEDEDVIRPVYPVHRPELERRRRVNEARRNASTEFQSQENWRYQSDEVLLPSRTRRARRPWSTFELDRVEPGTAGRNSASTSAGRMQLSRFYERSVEHGRPPVVEQTFGSGFGRVDQQRQVMEQLPPLAQLEVGGPQAEDVAELSRRVSGEQTAVERERQRLFSAQRDTNNKATEDTPGDPRGI